MPERPTFFKSYLDLNMELDPPKPKRIRPPKPRTQPLKRGKACLNCRHLKIRCDGVYPVCGNCVRVSKDEPCRYADPLSRKNLRSHLDDGNGRAGSSSLCGGVDVESGYSSPGVEFSTPASEVSSDSNHSSTEPPFETIQLLLQYFLPHAVQIGFFLHVDRFRNSTLLPQIPFGDVLRPCHSLLYAVYLWGAHLCQSGPIFELKPLFLRRALESVSTEICVHRDSVHAIHTIQAHVLLTNYFFLHRRFLPAQVHAHAAATLALGYRLHRLGTAPPPASSSIQDGDFPPFDEYLAPAHDSVEEGERIRCFWAVVSLQTNLNLAFASPIGLSSCLLESMRTTIDTPWPMQSTEYELQPGYSARDNCGRDVIRQFLAEECSVPIPVSHVQASVLLHRTSFLTVKWSSNLKSTELSSYMDCYTWLDGRITQFSDGLPPVYLWADHDLVLTHALVAAAVITLHRPFSTLEQAARMKCIVAARAIIRVLRDTTTIPHANPVIGTICALACNVLMDEIQRTHLVWTEWAQTLDVNTLPAGEQESTLLLNLQEGMGIMRMLAAGNPLSEHQSAEIQRQYNSHYGSL
ncbi:hypothetical protein B0H12DRAFT_1148679 [Mycena haematopus]|nr:hypothetical protein B0H12DRAFT_1148679 [Mycena haematopus]